MPKFTATADSQPIISVHADDVTDAKRMIAMLLRGRPGPDYYTKWVQAGETVLLTDGQIHSADGSIYRQQTA